MQAGVRAGPPPEQQPQVLESLSQEEALHGVVLPGLAHTDVLQPGVARLGLCTRGGGVAHCRGLAVSPKACAAPAASLSALEPAERAAGQWLEDHGRQRAQRSPKRLVGHLAAPWQAPDRAPLLGAAQRPCWAPGLGQLYGTSRARPATPHGRARLAAARPGPTLQCVSKAWKMCQPQVRYRQSRVMRHMYHIASSASGRSRLKAAPTRSPPAVKVTYSADRPEEGLARERGGCGIGAGNGMERRTGRGGKSKRPARSRHARSKGDAALLCASWWHPTAPTSCAGMRPIAGACAGGLRSHGRPEQGRHAGFRPQGTHASAPTHLWACDGTSASRCG